MAKKAAPTGSRPRRSAARSTEARAKSPTPATEPTAVPQEGASASPAEPVQETPRKSRAPRAARTPRIGKIQDLETQAAKPRTVPRPRLRKPDGSRVEAAASSLDALPDPSTLTAAAARLKKTVVVSEGPGADVAVAPPSAAADLKPAHAGAISSETHEPLPPALPEPVRQTFSVLFVASEAVPFSKSGGLADVAGALPAALARRGHAVTLVVPRYRDTAVAGEPISRIAVALGNETIDVACYERWVGPARVILVEADGLFDRGGFYGDASGDYEDNPRRFAVLSRAALEFAAREGHAVDIVHANDWQTGLVPVYLRTAYWHTQALGGAAAVFTIHNVAYQGVCPSGWLPALGLGWDLFTMDGLEYWGQISLLKAGITFSETLTTVSPRYAQEIVSTDLSSGFGGILAARQDDLVGVLNGIDTERWNPETDALIPARYGASDLAGKARCKRALLEAFGLPTDEDTLARPLVAMTGRMVEQKGLALLSSIAHQLPALDATFVVMGEGRPEYEEMWTALAAAHPARVAVRIGFDEPLSHLVEAGADIFMMPSRFEPCGLTQMYSLRYGTVPVVHDTGGLADTVQPFDGAAGTGNGFVFTEFTGEAFLGALRRALSAFGDRAGWLALQRRGMQSGHSWDAVAREYETVYVRARARTARMREAMAAASTV